MLFPAVKTGKLDLGQGLLCVMHDYCMEEQTGKLILLCHGGRAEEFFFNNAEVRTAIHAGDPSHPYLTSSYLCKSTHIQAMKLTRLLLRKGACEP